MAITAATKLSDFSGFIDAEVAGPIFEEAAKGSIIQRIARRVPLSYKGVDVPVVTSLPKATWVNEGVNKSATSGGMELVTMSPKKIAAIAVVSQEVVRANPGGYVDWLYPALAGSFAKAFDFAAIHGVGGDGTGTGPFDKALADATATVTLNTGTTYYNDLVSAGLSLSGDNRRLTGWLFDDYMEWMLLNELDGSNRPLFTDGINEETGAPFRSGRLLGRTAYFSDLVGVGTTYGFAGDFSKLAWGVVGGIDFSVSTEAAVTINGSLVSAFEANLVAIRAEAEYGFIMTEADNFVKFIKDNDEGATLGTPGFATP